MSNIVLDADLRQRAGKGSSRAVRRQGRIPAVIYGGKKQPVLISLEKRVIDVECRRAGFFNQVLKVKFDKSNEDVLVKDVQFHPVTDQILHFDFYRVSKSAVVTVEIPVHFENENLSPGLKRGGVLNIVRHTVELNCPASNIPTELVINLEGYEVGDSIHASAVALPEGATTVITDRDFTIATIAAPSALKSDAAEEAEAAEDTETDEEATEETSEEKSE